jgi:hypothetical protein
VFSDYLDKRYWNDDTFYSYITGEHDDTSIDHAVFFKMVIDHVQNVEWAVSHFINEYNGDSKSYNGNNEDIDGVMTDWFELWHSQYRIVSSYDLFRDMVLHQQG